MFRFECRLMCVYCVCQIAARASPAEQFIDLLRSSLRRDDVDKPFWRTLVSPTESLRWGWTVTPVSLKINTRHTQGLDPGAANHS